MKAQEIKGKIVSPQRISCFLIAPHRGAAADRSHQMAGAQFSSSALMKLKHCKVYLSSGISSVFSTEVSASVQVTKDFAQFVPSMLQAQLIPWAWPASREKLWKRKRGRVLRSFCKVISSRYLTGNRGMRKKHKLYRGRNLVHAEKLLTGNSQWGQQGRKELSCLLLGECGKRRVKKGRIT